MTNRQEGADGGEPPDLSPADLPDGTALRRLSVDGERTLRDECVSVTFDSGVQVTAENVDVSRRRDDIREVRSRPWYTVVNQWRDWYDGYRNAHLEYETPEGETVRSPLENSYQPEYGKRYYAKLKGLEREVERTYQGMTTVMLTFTASSENANGNPRCPADHMREIAAGYDAARKQLHQALSGRRWEYARVWEPHQSGYGHLHLAVFVEDADGDLDAEQFRPAIRSHVRNCDPAGSEAHDLGTPGLGDTVSVSDDIENLGSYISEYIGIFGEEPTERPITEQMFYATAWATGTRRVDFSNGAHDLMARDEFRRETGLRPEDRGGSTFEQWRGDGSTATTSSGSADDSADGSEPGGPTVRIGGSDGSDGSGWSVDSICTVPGRSPQYSDPTAGGAEMTRIDGDPDADPARVVR